jgi:hypothetical protein
MAVLVEAPGFCLLVRVAEMRDSWRTVSTTDPGELVEVHEH